MAYEYKFFLELLKGLVTRFIPSLEYIFLQEIEQCPHNLRKTLNETVVVLG
jgi:hypothetical protein